MEETVTKEKSSPNRVIIGGGIGGALGVLFVIMAPKFTALTFAGDEGAMVSAALGMVFSYLVRFIPVPKG